MVERVSEEGAKDRNAWPAFTLHHATVLFIASFNHSQGSENVQDWLLEYLHRLRPEIRISEQFKNEIKACAQPIVHRLLSTEGCPILLT